MYSKGAGKELYLSRSPTWPAPSQLQTPELIDDKKRMSTNVLLNFYAGENSLKDYYDPDVQLPVPLVEIPRKLNPYFDDGVRIYAKMLCALPAHNVKSFPALNMLQSLVSPDTKTIVEFSSGSTVISMSIISRILFGMDNTHAYMSNKYSTKKLQLMRFFGLNVTLFGGPVRPQLDDPRGGIVRAEKLAQEDPTVINPNQYENELNWKSHVRWTGPQLLKQLPNLKVFCAGIGTAGTFTGAGMFFKENKPDVIRVGVATEPEDLIPGLQTSDNLPYAFPLREIANVMVNVKSPIAFSLSMGLSREGLICGPSSGANLQGIYEFFKQRKETNSLRELAGEDGLIHSAFICCDLPYQYLDEYFQKLSFPKMTNENLLHVDTHFHGYGWEFNSTSLLPKIYPQISASLEVTEWHKILSLSTIEVAAGTVVVDLRTTADYNELHLPHATSKPLTSVTAKTPSPYFDSSMLEIVWLELEEVFASCAVEYGAYVSKEMVVLVCYDGDVSRLATTVLRARGVQAVSLEGGMKRLETYLVPSSECFAEE